MALPFSFGSSSSSQSGTQQSTSYTGQRSSQRSSQEGTRSIAEAGGLELEGLQTLMQAIYQNLQGAQGLVEGGYQDAIATGRSEFERLMTEGAKKSLSVMGKSGMNSSLVNNLMGAVAGGSAGQLAGNLMNLQATMPLQSLQAVNSVAAPLQQLLTGYFLPERSQNVTTTGSASNTMSGSQNTESSGSSSSRGRESRFGLQF